MSDTAAFQATIHGFRTIPSRGVLQVTIEAPIEEHARIAEIAQHGAWVAVARLEKKPEQTTPAKPKSFAQAVGAMCASAEFQSFLAQHYMLGAGPKEDETIKFVRKHCGVQSRADIPGSSDAVAKWNDLAARFDIWRHNANR